MLLEEALEKPPFCTHGHFVLSIYILEILYCYSVLNIKGVICHPCVLSDMCEEDTRRGDMKCPKGLYATFLALI